MKRPEQTQCAHPTTTYGRCADCGAQIGEALNEPGLFTLVDQPMPYGVYPRCLKPVHRNSVHSVTVPTEFGKQTWHKSCRRLTVRTDRVREREAA
jgi:hypothetical protein